MTEKFLSAIRHYNMLSAGDTVTVALSGGADSVALLHLLFAQKERLKIKLCAAHLNHNLRGEESLRDEQFVKKLCAELHVPLTLKSVDVAKLAEENGESIELAARGARYSFFAELGGKIATAHTATDNAETVLINLSRGTALRGVCGIPAVRDNFIRPLKFCTREEVEKYCAENGLSFVTDSTNFTDEYTRNKVRHGAVPVLRGINPAFDNAVTRFCLSAEDDLLLIERLADENFARCYKDGVLDLSSVKDRAIITRLVARYIECETGKSADFLHINEICGMLGEKNRVSVPGGMVEISGYRLRMAGNEKIKTFKVDKRIVSKENFDLLLKVNKLLLKNAIDCDKIADTVILRTRMEGDSIKLGGRGTKTLKKLYNEQNIPLHIRSALPIAADSDGVLWVCGVGVAQRVCVDDTTKNVMIFNWEET